MEFESNRSKFVADKRNYADEELDDGHPIGEVGSVVIHVVQLLLHAWVVPYRTTE